MNRDEQFLNTLKTIQKVTFELSQKGVDPVMIVAALTQAHHLAVGELNRDQLIELAELTHVLDRQMKDGVTH